MGRAHEARDRLLERCAAVAKITEPTHEIVGRAGVVIPERRPHAHEVTPPGHVVGGGSTTSAGLHARVTKALGWEEGESKKFSLSTLRELVKTTDPGLAEDLTDRIRSGMALRE